MCSKTAGGGGVGEEGRSDLLHALVGAPDISDPSPSAMGVTRRS